MLPTKDELRERYAAYSNNRLLEIVNNKDEYTADALDVARAALAERNITAADVDQYLDDIEGRKALAGMLSQIKLSFKEKLLFFFVWFVIFGKAIQMNYAEDGLSYKLKQSRRFSIAGFTSMLIVGIISVILDLNTATSSLILVAMFFIFVWVEKRTGQ